tara:strand:+ start:167 stop:448 length:282 start_codon:yes stop_codon:yes gene_type:complete
MCLTHTPKPEYDFDSPLIEFYDTRYDFDKDTDGTPLGQFVSSYYLSTLHGPLRHHPTNRGVQLHGNEPAWTVDRESLAKVIRWAVAVRLPDEA